MDNTDSLRSMIILNSMGDVEITWDSSKDDQMREIIAKKMAEGVKFFVLKPVLGSFLHRKAKLKSINDLKQNHIKINDSDIEAMFVAGNISVFRNETSEIETTHVAKTAQEAVTTNTVAITPLRGG